MVSEKEFFGFTADISSRADISGESDISDGQRSDESSTEDAESNSRSVESRNEEEWRYILNLLLMRISINPLGLQLFLQPQPLLVIFST